jgi:hypothetical protein
LYNNKNAELELKLLAEKLNWWSELV